MLHGSRPTLRRLTSIVVRIVVLVVTVSLLVLMFERGGWWIAACLAWLPINFAVVAYFGDDKHSGDAPVFFPD